MKVDDVEIKWLGHSGFFIKNFVDSKTIYIDPFKISDNREKADLILITHGHYDHCSVEDMGKIIKEGTRIVIPADCQSKINKFKIPVKIDIVIPGQELNYGNVKINTVPSYNIDKTFHPREEGWLGYLIKIREVIIYHAGDTDLIPEMQRLTGYPKDKKFIAFFPVGGRFTMNVEEAVEAAKIIKPFLAVPIHYGSIVGEENDAREFVQLCKEEGVNAEILEKE
jgi:L-ascorbate metabolism protein UlaG (beta-lactamase superfamily)